MTQRWCHIRLPYCMPQKFKVRSGRFFLLPPPSKNALICVIQGSRRAWTNAWYTVPSFKRLRLVYCAAKIRNYTPLHMQESNGSEWGWGKEREREEDVYVQWCTRACVHHTASRLPRCFGSVAVHSPPQGWTYRPSVSSMVLVTFYFWYNNTVQRWKNLRLVHMIKFNFEKRLKKLSPSGSRKADDRVARFSRSEALGK